jgi:RNA polymerase sigma factor FliA
MTHDTHVDSEKPTLLHRLQDGAETACSGGVASIAFTSTAQLAPPPETRHEPQVMHHLGLVRRIARQVAARLPCHFEIEDLVQAGMVGLLEAAERYSGSVSFETYARHRIRGAILDSVRKYDWRPRSHHRHTREINAAKSSIENETGATAKSADVVAALGWSNKAYHRALQDSASIQLLSLDELRGPEGELECDALFESSANPADEVEQKDWHRAVASAIEGLSKRERAILLLYYDGEYSLRAIGTRCGLSESRVCQILRQSIRRLRAWMLAIELDGDSMLAPAPSESSSRQRGDRRGLRARQRPKATHHRMRNPPGEHLRLLAGSSLPQTAWTGRDLGRLVDSQSHVKGPVQARLCPCPLIN